MNVNSVSFTGNPNKTKKPLTKGQKAAIATTAVVGTLATASVVAAYALGKGKAPDAKLLAKFTEGYKTMGKFVADNAKVAGEWIAKKAGEVADAAKKTFANLTSKFGSTAEEAATLADDIKMI